MNESKLNPDPAEWSVEGREAYLIEKIGWDEKYYLMKPNFETDAHSCRLLRAKLVDMVFHFVLSNCKDGFDCSLYFDTENDKGKIVVDERKAQDPSEGRAVVIAACRALIARGKE